MIALTARLNEWDDTIIQLQSEMDALERINKDQETEIYNQRSWVQDLEILLRENSIDVPSPKSNKSNPRRLSSFDGQRRYLPHSHNGIVPEDLLMSADDDSQLDFMTAEEKVEELQALIA